MCAHVNIDRYKERTIHNSLKLSLSSTQAPTYQLGVLNNVQVRILVKDPFPCIRLVGIVEFEEIGDPGVGIIAVHRVHPQDIIRVDEHRCIVYICVYVCVSLVSMEMKHPKRFSHLSTGSPPLQVCKLHAFPTYRQDESHMSGQ